MVIDDPGRNGLSPKSIEQERRDSSRDDRAGNVIPVEDDIALPGNWHAFTGNRQQERLLVNYICEKLLMYETSMLLKQGKKLVVAGGFDDDRRDKAYSIMQGQAPVPEPYLDSNHEESDSRVWLHAFGSKMSRVLVYSPDTDTYHIGLPLLDLYAGTEIIVHLSPSPAATPYEQSKFLLLNCLREALHNDSDLGDIVRPLLTPIFRALFVTKGCDYVSFFARIGKATFLDSFFQNAAFITG